MQYIDLLCGIPGSGKTTYAEDFVDEMELNGLSACHISRDICREKYCNEGADYFTHEKEVFEDFVKEINDSLELGINHVVIDATHINHFSRQKLLKRLVYDPHTILNVIYFTTPLDICLNRNFFREGFERVPTEAINRMAEEFENPTKEEFNQFNFARVNVIKN